MSVKSFISTSKFRSKAIQIFLFFLFLMATTSCDIIDGIFKTGVGIGAFVVIIVVLLIFFISRSVRRK